MGPWYNKACSTSNKRMSNGFGSSFLTFAALRLCVRFALGFLAYLGARQEAQRLGILLAELLRVRCARCCRWMMVESGDPQSSRRIDEVVNGHKG